MPTNDPNPFTSGFEPNSRAIVNPYAPTVQIDDMQGHETDSEWIRRKYLSHEVSIKSIGSLYLFCGVLMSIYFVLMLAGFIVGAILRGGFAWRDNEMGIIVLIAVVYGGVGFTQLYVGRGLRRFSIPAKRIATIFSAIGLLLFPFGTLINGYFLYLLVGKKGVYVFSDEYQDIIKKTPHIEYKTSLIVKFFGWLLALAIILVIIAAFSGW